MAKKFEYSIAQFQWSEGAEAMPPFRDELNAQGAEGWEAFAIDRSGNYLTVWLKREGLPERKAAKKPAAKKRRK